MDIGGHIAGAIKRADTNEIYRFAYATEQNKVVAPKGDLAFWAASDPLALAAGRRYSAFGDIAMKQLHTIGFNECVQRK